MITHLLFFTLVLLLIGFAPIEDVHAPKTAGMYFLTIFSLYTFCLTLIWLQNAVVKRMKEKLYIISQIEIFLFLIGYYFIFHTASILPKFSPIFKSQTVSGLLTLFLYLFATGLYYFTSYGALPSKRYVYAKRQLKILLPFVLPFIIFSLMADTILLWKINPLETFWSGVLFLFFSALFLSIIFPYLICKLWECKPLADEEIKQRLEIICKKARFTHGGLKIWNLFAYTPTAAILGILPHFRYVLFTPSLLKNLSPEALEAVLAHEIGHSKYKHLLFFPIILFGLFIFLSLVLEIVPAFSPLLLFVIIAVLVAFYFRFIFGFFSRLLEREADLYGIQLGIPVHSMIEALDTIGILTGQSHKIPNWHHFSIDQRIQFLKRIEENPLLAKRYHFYVRKVQIAFILLLILCAKLAFKF